MDAPRTGLGAGGRIRPWLAALVALIVFAGSAEATAECPCDKVRRGKHPDELHFWGRAEKVEDTEDGGTRVLFSPAKMYRGKAVKTVVVSTPSVDDACGYRFLPGDLYVVDAKEHADGTFWTDRCSQTGAERYPGFDTIYERDSSLTAGQRRAFRRVERAVRDAIGECDGESSTAESFMLFDTGDLVSAATLWRPRPMCISKRVLALGRVEMAGEFPFKMEFILGSGVNNYTTTLRRNAPLAQNHLRERLLATLTPKDESYFVWAANFAEAATDFAGETKMWSEAARFHCMAEGVGRYDEYLRARYDAITSPGPLDMYTGDGASAHLNRLECAFVRRDSAEITQATDALRGCPMVNLALKLTIEEDPPAPGFPHPNVEPDVVVRYALSGPRWWNNPPLLEWVGWALAHRKAEQPWYAELAAMAYLRAGLIDSSRYAGLANYAEQLVGDAEAFQALELKMRGIRDKRADQLREFAHARTATAAVSVMNAVDRQAVTVTEALANVRAQEARIARSRPAKPPAPAYGRKALMALVVMLLCGVVLFFARSRW